jgi:hypothetical protein
MPTTKCLLTSILIFKLSYQLKGKENKDYECGNEGATNSSE